MLTVLLPAAINPIIGKYTSRVGPRWWSVCAFSLCGSAMFSFGQLAGGSHKSQVLFVVHASVVGIALAVLVNANQVAISVASQRYGKVMELSEKRGHKVTGLLGKLSPGKMLSGVTTSWSAGTLLGPVYTSLLDFTDDAGWRVFCYGLGGVTLAAALGSAFIWRRW